METNAIVIYASHHPFQMKAVFASIFLGLLLYNYLQWKYLQKRKVLLEEAIISLRNDMSESSDGNAGLEGIPDELLSENRSITSDTQDDLTEETEEKPKKKLIKTKEKKAKTQPVKEKPAKEKPVKKQKKSKLIRRKSETEAPDGVDDIIDGSSSTVEEQPMPPAVDQNQEILDLLNDDFSE